MNFRLYTMKAATKTMMKTIQIVKTAASAIVNLCALLNSMDDDEMLAGDSGVVDGAAVVLLSLSVVVAVVSLMEAFIVV